MQLSYEAVTNSFVEYNLWCTNYYYVFGIFRHYLLDLMRVTPRDANYTGPGSRFCVLRPELIAAYCQVKYLLETPLYTYFII